MIDEEEFERRAAHWIGLVLKALEENIRRAINNSCEWKDIDRHNPQVLTSMEEADVYRLMYLPEEVLAHFLDPKVPAGYFDTQARADFLLQQGIAQRHACQMARQVIAQAKVESAAHKYR